MIVTTKELFKIAYGNYAVSAYNINNLEQAMGLFKGCIESQAPFIIQLSKGARTYTDKATKAMLEDIIRSVEVVIPEAIFAVHLDHRDEQTYYDCINSGFYSSVMIDASHDPFCDPFKENIAITKRLEAAAHAKGISVKANLSILGIAPERASIDEKNAYLIDPEEAKLLEELSGYGSRAAAIDTSHDAWRLSFVIAASAFIYGFCHAVAYFLMMLVFTLVGLIVLMILMFIFYYPCSPKPSWVAELLLHCLLPQKERENIIGDLLEEYQKVYDRCGKKKWRADVFLLSQVIGSSWPFLKRFAWISAGAQLLDWFHKLTK